MKKYIYLFFAISLLTSATVLAQEGEQEIDASKPTNFYSLLDNTLENTAHSTHNVFDYRGKILFAPSEAHLILGEIPLMYNDQTSKFGLGDVRARYFFLPYKNYDKFVGAFGPSIDIFMPTGNYENGLGNGRWVFSPGVTVGLMAADWIQFFPILSYQYSSKPVYDNPPVGADKAAHGLSFQVITPVVFSDKFYMQITPIFKMNNINDVRQDRYIQELLASYALNSKMQLSGYYNGNFEDKIHTVSFGLTVFL